jgi:probable HAF family extracellular repeat protein
VHTNVIDDTACDLGGLPGVCTTGVCENAYDYDVIDLGPIGSSGTMRGVNNAGQIIGNSTLSGSSRAFAIDNGTVVDLHTLFGATLASDINDAGQIVGRASGGAFRHSLSSETTTFIGGGTALGINEAGHVVGTNGLAYVWRDANADGLFDASELTDLGALPGDVSSRAYAINEDNQIVGLSNNPGSFTRPVVWKNDAPSPLNLGTPNQATAEDINNSGLIVGHIGDFGVGFTPFLFDPVNDMTTHLGSGIARGINNQGAVVGGTAGGSFPSPAFLWTSDDGFRALDDLVDPTLGWTLVRAWDINELGWIVGEGDLAGERHGFVLIPY